MESLTSKPSPREGSRGPVRPTFEVANSWAGFSSARRARRKSFRRSDGGDWTERLTRNRLEDSPLRWHYFTLALVLQTQREVTMKRTLIAIASAGFLTSTAWVVAANAQANINPNVYPVIWASGTERGHQPTPLRQPMALLEDMPVEP